MAGIGDSWGTREELLHPRDKHGRFRNTWKMAEGVANKILAALAAFSPRQFQSDGQASQYLHNKAKPSRFGGGQGYPRLSADFDAANDALRAGTMDASTQKFVKMMDDSAIDLPDDIIVSRKVGPEAFGLTPETMGLDQGGLEDFTGKLIADRGYTSSNIGNPMGSAPIQVSIAVPKGTKAIIPGRSPNDRQIYLDRDQEIRVTKVTPDGRGGFYVLAVAQPRTPGETPAPVGGPGAPGDVTAREGQVEQGRQLALKAMKVPNDAQPAQHGTPRQRQEQGLAPNPADLQGPVDTGPGGPPPRNEPVHAESIGTGGTPQVTAPPAAAPEVPGGAPATPIREADFKEAAKALPIPSAGKRRREWNAAYLGVRSGKRDPDDLLRELERDIEVNRGTLADQKSRGDSSDPQLADDIAAQEKLADLIRTHHAIDGKTSGEATPTPEPVKAAKKAAPAKRVTTPAVTPEQSKDIADLSPQEQREYRALRRKGQSHQDSLQGARDLVGVREANKAAAAEKALAKKAAPAKATPTPTPEERQDIAKLDLPTKKEYRALRREGKSHEDALQGARDRNLPPTPAKKATPVKAIPAKAVPAERPMTLAEAKRRTALDAVHENPIDDPTADTTYKRITKGLEDGTMTVPQARKQALDSARYFHESATTVGRNGMTTPEKRGAAHASETAKATKYEKLAEALQVSQGTLKTDKYRRAKAAAPKKSVEGAAPGTAAGKITAARVQPGMKILARLDDSGAWVPTQRKTDATSITVSGSGATTGGRKGRTRRQITGTDPDGNEVTIRNLSPSQTFIVDQRKEIGTEAARASQENLQAVEALPEPPANIDLMTKPELVAEAKRRGLPVKSSMNKTELKGLFSDERRLEAETGPATPGSEQARAAQAQADGLNVTVRELQSIADSEGVPRRGRPKNKADLQNAIRARREEKANLTPEDQAIIDSLGNGPTPAPTPTPATPSDIMQRISSFDNPPTRDEAHEMLKPLPKRDLVAMAKDLSVPGAQGLTKERLRDEIVEATTGRRRDSIATRGFRGARPDSPEVPEPLSADPAVREIQVENRIRTAYRTVLERHGQSPGRSEFVGLADIRDELGEDVPRAEVDRVLRDMTVRSGDPNEPGAVRLITVANSKSLKQRDLDSAIPVPGAPQGPQVGGLHAIAMADPSPRPIPTPEVPEPLSIDPATREIQVDNRVRAAYVTALAAKGGPGRSDNRWVMISDIRPELGDLSREEVDAALIRMGRGDYNGPGGPHIIPESNQKALTPAHRAGAVHFGDQDKHAISFDDPSPRPIPTVVANPVAQKVIKAPDRAADFRLAWHRGGDFKETGSVGRQLDEIRDDIGSGKITPDEGIRRLEGEIGFNKDELNGMDADLRGDLGEEQRHLLKQKRDALAKGIRTQEKASTFLRTHFKKEPVATPDEVKVQLDEAGQRALDGATPDGLRQAAKAQGITVKGETKYEILKDLVRQMAGKELERRAAEAKKVAPAPKAPDKPKPNLEQSSYQRIDTQALAEGLDLRTEWDQRMMARVQAQLDGTDTSLGKNPTPAQIGRNLEKWADGPAGPAYRAATMHVTRDENRTPEWHAEIEAFRAQHQEWLKLADRLKNTRRRKKEDRAPDVTPTVSKDEKKVIADVAEATGIPAPQLEAKVLAKKKAEAPPKQSAVQVAETLKTVGSREEATTLLQGRTKAELMEIAKASGMTTTRSSDTKPKLIDDIVSGTVGGRLSFEVLTRGGMRGDTGGKPTRADLEDMSLADLVDLEDELGIQRASLNRGDRIDAILAKQSAPATPAPAAPTVTLTPRSDISVHGDSQLGSLWDRLPKNDQEQIRLANRINDLGIDLSVRRKDDASAPQDVIDSLKALLPSVTDPGSRAQIDSAIKQMESPSVKVPDSPALSGSPPSIQTMVQSLAKIPVARKTGRMPSGGSRQTSVLDEVLRLIKDIDEGKADRSPDTKLHDLLRTFHESVEGAYQMWNLEPLIRTQEVRKWILSKRRQ